MQDRHGLKNITTSIQKFAEVVVESKPCKMVFVRRKNKQAQMMVAELSPPMSVENTQLNQKQKINTKETNIRGCSLLPDGIESFQIGKDKTGSSTYDTVYIKDDNSVAVSSGGGGKGCITIIDIESQKVMTTIRMDTCINGMAVRGGTIYYCTTDNRLKMLNLSDKSVSDIISSSMSGLDYVDTSGDKLYCTNYGTRTVTCCDLHGTTQWEFKGERVLQGPLGISVDKDGNVYIAGYKSNNVVVISPDVQRHRQLLSSKDGLSYPIVLDYDKSTNRLLVVNYMGTAFMFDVTKGEYEKSRTLYINK
jgi:DNA-binding beta-propeller fold protein YncE